MKPKKPSPITFVASIETAKDIEFLRTALAKSIPSTDKWSMSAVIRFAIAKLAMEVRCDNPHKPVNSNQQ